MPLRTVPPGVTTGHGVLNFVNCRSTTLSSRNNNYHVLGSSCGSLSPLRVPTFVLRYCDFNLSAPSSGAVLCGGTGCYPNSIANTIVDSVYAPTQAYGDGFAYFFFAYAGAPALSGLTYLQNVKSTNPALAGTSRYTAGYAPVPTEYVINVGPGRTYTTLLAGYQAAQHGDNIVVDPGSYDISDFYTTPNYVVLVKAVRIYGATENPSDVMFYSKYPPPALSGGTSNAALFSWGLWNMGNVPVDMRGPGFFHVSFFRSTGGVWWKPSFTIETPAGGDVNPWNPGEEEPTISSIMFSCNT